jgi:hypothetical protein
MRQGAPLFLCKLMLFLYRGKYHRSNSYIITTGSNFHYEMIKTHLKKASKLRKNAKIPINTPSRNNHW